LEHEIRRKAIGIALHRLVKNLDLDPIEFREVEIDHDFLTSNQIDSALDELNRDGETVTY
jgi:hypothetical protein